MGFVDNHPYHDHHPIAVHRYSFETWAHLINIIFNHRHPISKKNIRTCTKDLNRMLCGRPAHLVVCREHIKVPHDLRRRGAWGAAHSFDIAPLHLSHGSWGDLYFGNHCVKWANRETEHLDQNSTSIGFVFRFLSVFVSTSPSCLREVIVSLKVQYQIPSVAYYNGFTLPQSGGVSVANALDAPLSSMHFRSWLSPSSRSLSLIHKFSQIQSRGFPDRRSLENKNMKKT